MKSQEQIIRWLRDVESQELVINLTMAMHDSSVVNAMRKCADIIELGNHLTQEPAEAPPPNLDTVLGRKG